MRYIYKYLIIFFILVISALFYISDGSHNWKYTFYTVSSESMRPALNKGDLLVTGPADDFSAGDIVTFKSPADMNSYITHRIERENFEEERFFNTKGDNNSNEDPWQITRDMIVGKLIMHVPLAGYPVLFLKSSKIYAFVLAGLALLIGFIEINSFSREAAYEWERKNSCKFYRMIRKWIYRADRFFGRIYKFQEQKQNGDKF